MTEFSIPNDFVRYEASETNIKLDLRYFSNCNFIGRRIDGYHTDDVLILTQAAATQLLKVQEEFMSEGSTLVVYDAYRPAKAVQDVVNWAEDVNEIAMKEIFYPNLDKKSLFSEGYVCEKSSHSRESTIDVSFALGSSNLDRRNSFLL